MWSIKLLMMLGGMVWSSKLFILLGTICLIMCPKIKADMIIIELYLTIFPAVDSTSAIQESFSPMTCCPLTSQVLCSERRPFLAEELSFTMDVIFPFFEDKVDLSSPILIQGNCPFKGPVTNGHGDLLPMGLSRMVMVIFSPKACLNTLSAWSELQPTQFLICSAWFPNRRPTREDLD